MKLTQLLLDELDREAPRTRRALEHVPAGREDWKPHPKSMPLGRLAGLVASMPSWVTLIIEQDELDLTPPAGGGQYQQPATGELGDTLDKHVAKARESLAKTNDENLTAVEAGNSPKMIHQSYRQIKDHTGRVITPELADIWFSIEPEASGKVLPIGAAA